MWDPVEADMEDRAGLEDKVDNVGDLDLVDNVEM